MTQRTFEIMVALSLSTAVGCAESTEEVGRLAPAAVVSCADVGPFNGDFELVDDPDYAGLLMVTNVGNAYEPIASWPWTSLGARMITVRRVDGAFGLAYGATVTIADNYQGNGSVNGPEFVYRADAAAPVGLGVVYAGEDGVHAVWRARAPLAWDAFGRDETGGLHLDNAGLPLSSSIEAGPQPGATPGGVSAFDTYLSFNVMAAAAIDGGVPLADLPLPVDVTHPCQGEYCLGSLAGGPMTPVAEFAKAELATVGPITVHPFGDGVLVMGCRVAGECGVYEGFVDGTGGMLPAAPASTSSPSFRRIGEVDGGAFVRETLRAEIVVDGDVLVRMFGYDPAAQAIRIWELAWRSLPQLPEIPELHGSPGFPDRPTLPAPLPGGYYAWVERTSVSVTGFDPEHFRIVSGDGATVLDFQDRGGANAASYALVVDDDSVGTPIAYSASTYSTELTYLPDGVLTHWASYAGNASTGRIQRCLLIL